MYIIIYFKENERPPVYNAEDYIAALKNYSRRTNGANNTRSIYDTSDGSSGNTPAVPPAATSSLSSKDKRTSTLPTKHSDYK